VSGERYSDVYIPDANAFTTDNMKSMNQTSWGLLATLVAGKGFYGLELQEGFTPGPPERERAAAVIEKALGLWHAETMDEVRAVLGNLARGIPAVSLEDYMERTRVTLATGALRKAEEMRKDGGTGNEALDKVLSKSMDFASNAKARLMAENFARGAVLAWDVLRKFRDDPSWIPTDFEVQEMVSSTQSEDEKWKAE